MTRHCEAILLRSGPTLVWLLAGAFRRPAAAESFLVEDGRHRAATVIAGELPRTVELAAEELQTYVGKISGAKPAIVAEPHCKTRFRAGWAGGSRYLGIRCDEPRPESLNIAARKGGDMGIWDGDNVEILIETQTHSHYQIAISPNAKIVDLDRKDRLNTRWSSGAQVASHIGEDFWTLEVRIPAAGDMAASVDPLNGVAGRKPSGTYPWYFNISDGYRSACGRGAKSSRPSPPRGSRTSTCP